MLICHCQRVNDRRIRDVVVDGARTVGQIAKACGAGSRCGGCVRAVIEVLEEEQQHSPSTLDLPIAAQ